MSDLKRFNELCHDELILALKNVYPIRDKLQETLIDSYNDELLDKVIQLNKIIEDAEFLLNREKDVKEFYAKRNPDKVDDDNNINEIGIQRVNFLKKKWKKLGYLRKNS